MRNASFFRVIFECRLPFPLSVIPFAFVLTFFLKSRRGSDFCHSVAVRLFAPFDFLPSCCRNHVLGYTLSAGTPLPLVRKVLGFWEVLLSHLDLVESLLAAPACVLAAPALVERLLDTVERLGEGLIG